MAGTSLIVDDDYCKDMGTFFVNQGRELENFLNEYIGILENINKSAIIKGDVALALNSYILYAKKMKGQINKLSGMAEQQCKKFISAIDYADQYIF